jgi:hypothetical protein
MPTGYIMKINEFFPTRVLSDINTHYAETLLPLCNKYTELTDTGLLGTENYPSTLANEKFNDQVNSEPAVVEFFEFILEYYARPLIEAKNIEYRPTLFRPYGFFSSMERHAFLRKHAHQNCTFSGTFYLEVGKNVPPLIMHDPRPFTKFDCNDLQSQIIIHPKAGLFLMWDHWVEHEVFQKLNDEPRKAFSFNL